MDSLGHAIFPGEVPHKAKAQKAEDNETAVQLTMQIASNQEKLEDLGTRLDALKATPTAPTYEQLQSKIQDLKKQREIGRAHV